MNSLEVQNEKEKLNNSILLEYLVSIFIIEF